MDAIDIDKAVVFGDNDLVFEAAESFHNKFILFFYFDLRYEETQLARGKNSERLFSELFR